MSEKDIIEEIRCLDEDKIDEWIDQRINFLENTAIEDRNEISLISYTLRRAKGEKENTEVHGYIPKTTKLKKDSFDIASFVLDDTSYYKQVVDFIRDAKDNNIINTEKDIVNNNYIMQIIQCAIINYLGLYSNESKRNALYNSRADIDNNILSIKEFKRNGTAMCAEKSSMSQNILAFLGYDPMMIYGYMSTNKGVNNQAHAYNCIIRNGKAMLVDFTNPSCKDGQYYRPSCYPVNGENLSKFMKGKAQIEVEHKDFYTENGENKEDITSVVYASEEIDPKYFEKKKTKVYSEQEIGAATIKVPTAQKDKASQVGNSKDTKNIVK